MTVSDKTIRAYGLLAERESHRRQISMQPASRYPSPENVFYSVANSQRNKGDNRYSDILSYDRTSVTVGEKGYINANVVCGSNGHWWVAAQAPVPSTFPAYFHALYHQSASKHPLIAGRAPTSNHSKAVVIVQLTDYEERGRPKADKYIPELIHGGGPHLVSMGYEEDDTEMYLETRLEDRLEDLSTTLTQALLYPKSSSGEAKGEAMKLRHFLFNAWPDHGVPTGQAVQKLKALVEHIGKERERLGDCEVWVHCSAGIGRTGAFLALSSLLLPPKQPSFASEQSPLGPLPKDIQQDRVAASIDQMREYRGMLVQTVEQMQLVYDLTS